MWIIHQRSTVFVPVMVNKGMLSSIIVKELRRKEYTNLFHSGLPGIIFLLIIQLHEDSGQAGMTLKKLGIIQYCKHLSTYI
jgi:hypothetical protein